MNKRKVSLIYFLLFFSIFFSSIPTLSAVDLDFDGMDDNWEILFGLNPLDPTDATQDPDNDSLINLYEYLLGFDPLNNNSDSTLTLFNESTNSVLDSMEDIDNDGISNIDEILNSTNPFVSLQSNLSKTDITIGESVCYNIKTLIIKNPNIFLPSYLYTNLPNELVYLNSTNNASILPTVSGQNISWNIGEILTPTQFHFNICAYLNNSASVNQSTLIPSIYSYFQTNMSIETTNTSQIGVTEPMITINTFSEFSSYQTNISPTQIIPVQINLSNIGTSNAYNLTLNSSFSSNLIFINSSPVPILNSSNPNYLIYKFSNFSSNQTILLYFQPNSSNQNMANANDILWIKSNATYYSYPNSTSTNNSIQVRNYSITNSQLNFVIKEPQISIFSNKINSSIGELINYTFRLNFSQSKALNVILESNLTYGMEFINQTSNVANDFTLLSPNKFRWNLSNLNLSTYDYEINLTILTNSSLSESDIITNILKLTYESSNATSAEKTTQLNLTVFEPNLILVSSSPAIIKIDESFIQQINITNIGNSTSYQTNLTLTIPNGTKFLQSSPIETTITGVQNQTIHYNLNHLNPGQSIQINLTLNLTSSYYDSKPTLAHDEFQTSVNLSYLSTQNQLSAKKYFHTQTTPISSILQPTITFAQDKFNMTIEENITYTIELNFSNTQANNVTLVSYLPNGITFINQTSTFNTTLTTFQNTTSTLTFSFNNITNQTINTITIKAKTNQSPNANDILTNNINLSYFDSNNIEHNLISASSVTIVEPLLQMSISAFSPVNIGDALTYIIDITNVGNSTAYSPILTNLLANGTTFLYSNPIETLKIGMQNQTIIYNITDLANITNIYSGQSIQINLTVNITDKYYSLMPILANDSLTNFANISYYSISDINVAKNYLSKANATTILRNGAINKNTTGTITINSTPATNIGEVFLYTVVINFTGAPANSVKISDQLHPDLDFMNQTNSYNPVNTSQFNQTGNLLEWNFGNLNTSTKIIYINFTAKIKNTTLFTTSQSINNIINLTYSNSLGSSILRQDSAQIYLTEPNMIINKTLLTPNTSNPLELINYTLTISNPQRLANPYNSKAYNITLIELIPDGLILNSTSLQPNISNKNNLTWYLSDFDVNDILNINFSFKINSTYSSNSNYVLSNDSFSILAKVSYQGLNDTQNSKKYSLNSQLPQTTILPPKIQLMQFPNNASIGDIITYLILLNTSNAPINNAILNNTLAYGINFLNFTSSQNSNFTFSQNLNSLIFNFKNITNQLTNLTNLTNNQFLFYINITGRVNSSLSQGATPTNTLSLTYSNSSNLQFQINSQTQTIINEPDLIISKQNLYDVQIGDILNYTINITNTGSDLAYNPSLTEIIGDGLEFVNSSLNTINISGNRSEIINFNLLNLSPSQTFSLNLVIKVLSNYSNSNKILSNDIIYSNTNLSYYSNQNLSIAKSYLSQSNSSTTLFSPLISITTKNINLPNSIIFNDENLTGIKIGDSFTYNLNLDFTNKPASNPILTNSIPSNFEFVSEQNSFNPSSFTNSFNNLTWNFSTINTNLTTKIQINLTLKLKDIPSNIKGNKINSIFNFTYQNTLNNSFSSNHEKGIYIIEPFLNLNLTQSQTLVEFFETITYTINISNPQDSFNQTAPAYNISITNFLPDGINFVSSSHPRTTSNIRNLTFYLSDIDITNNAYQINITVFINNILLNLSPNNVSSMVNVVNITYFSNPYSNFTNKRIYTQSKNISTFLYDITKPTISQINIAPTSLPIGQNISFNLQAFDEVELDTCWVQITLPNSIKVNSTKINNPCTDNMIYTLPMLVGTYNVTFFANDTSSNIANTSLTNPYQFKAGPILYANVSVIIQNISGLNTTNFNTTLNIYQNTTKIISKNNLNGNFTNQLLSNFTYDLEFISYNKSFRIKLNGVNISDNLNETIGFDKITNNSQYLSIYGVYNNNYTFNNAQVNISYKNLFYSNENYLKLKVCENWIFSNQTCNSTWQPLTATQDIITKSFIFTRTKFSAFAIFEQISAPSTNSGGAGGGGGGGSYNFKRYNETGDNGSLYPNPNTCQENWTCTVWSECYKTNTQTRICEDENSCKTFFNKPITTKSCSFENITNLATNNDSNNTSNTEVNSLTDKIIEKSTNHLKKSYEMGKYSYIQIIIYLLLILDLLYLKHTITSKHNPSSLDMKLDYIKYHKNIHIADKTHFSKKFYIIFITILITPPIGLFLFHIPYSFMIGILIELCLSYYLYRKLHNY